MLVSDQGEWRMHCYRRGDLMCCTKSFTDELHDRSTLEILNGDWWPERWKLIKDTCNKEAVERSTILRAYMEELTCHWHRGDTDDQSSQSTQVTVATVGAAHADDPYRGMLQRQWRIGATRMLDEDFEVAREWGAMRQFFTGNWVHLKPWGRFKDFSWMSVVSESRLVIKEPLSYPIDESGWEDNV